MRFEDDELVYCEVCGDEISAGDDYLKYDGLAFCDEDCLGEYLVKEAEANDEIEVVHIKSAEDKMDEWADREYHRRVEEDDEG